MPFDASTSNVETNLNAISLTDNTREQCSCVSTSIPKPSLLGEEPKISLKRSPRCRKFLPLPQPTDDYVSEYTSESMRHTPYAVITPSLGTSTISNCSTTTTNDCFLRDPESLLLSIINMVTSSPPQTSTQKPIPTVQSSLDSCQVLEKQVLESLPHLSSLQVSPISERKGHIIRPTTAIDSRCNAGILFIRERYNFSNLAAEFPRCLSAKTVTKYPDSVFDSELESSCITPRFLHAVPLRESPDNMSQNEANKSSKETILTCSPRLQCLTHVESSAISTVDALNTSSSCATTTPTAPLSARMPPTALSNIVRQQDNDSDKPLNNAGALNCMDVKSGNERKQTQSTGPIPLLALHRCSVSTMDNKSTYRSPNGQNIYTTHHDSKEPDSHFESGTCSNLKKDSDGSAGTSARRFQSLNKHHNITNLKLSTNIHEPGKSSVRSTTDNIHLDFALPECSSARFDPSTRQLEQSVQNFEPEQLCILNTHAITPETALAPAAFQPLIAVATCNNANEANMLSSLRLTDIVVNPKSEADLEESHSEESTTKHRCKSTPSSRPHIRPVPCHDPIFDAASFKVLSESGDSATKLDIAEQYSLRRVHTSLLTHDSSMGHSSYALSKSLNFNVLSTQERPKKYLITSGRISITPARKNLRVSLVQLDQFFDDTQVAGKIEDNKRCRSSGSMRTSHTDITSSRPSSMHGARSHSNNHCTITLTPIVASSHSQSRSSKMIDNSINKQNGRIGASRGSSCHNITPTPYQRKSMSTPRPRLQLEPIIQNEQSTPFMVKHPTSQETSSRIRSHQQRLQTGNLYKSNNSCGEDIRQAMARMCLSNTEVDKYRTLSVQQRLKGLHPLVRGSKVISED